MSLRLRVALGLALALAWAAQFAQFRDVQIDDAFISYRYADNLARGRGFVFNPGEWRLGSTAPGHVLLAAGVRLVVGPDALPLVMVAVGCLAWTAQAALLFGLLSRRLGHWPAGAAAAGVLLGVAGSGLLVSLETNLVVAFVLASTLAADRGRPALAAALAGLAVLTRPDALAFVGLLALWGVAGLRGAGAAASPGWRRALRPALAFAAPLVPWMLFAWITFGSPLPATAAAKYAKTPLAEYALHLLRIGPTRFAPADAPLALGLIAALAVYGAVRWARSGPAGALLVAWALGHGLSYLVLRPLTLFTWHLNPVTVVFAACALIGLGCLAERRSGARAIAWSARAALALVLLATAARSHGEAVSYAGSYWGGQRTAVYLQVADWLRANVRAEQRVALLEVGLIVYHSDVRVHDLAGLVTPRTRALPADVTHVVVVTHFPKDYITGRQPVAAFRQGRFGAWIFDLRTGPKPAPSSPGR